ncbi:unnamed protein product [Adineta steineri]|uniref:Transmembrane protein n=1 Tax=Adineta steineri TaxID=433720 RepID=A0A813TYL1_9BILA|nr:unnamed protein product [Adineta steineri]
MKSNKVTVYNDVPPVNANPIQPSTFTMNLQPNRQSAFTNNGTSIYFNDKQPNNSLSPNIESGFNPTANYSLDSQSINELVDLQKKRVRKRMMYIYIISGILFLIGLVLLIIGFVVPRCSSYSDDCPSGNLRYLAVGIVLMVCSIVLVLGSRCATCCCIKQQFEDVNFSVTGQQPVVWRLDSEQWVQYLNYTHGPNRVWTEKARFSFFCCRRSTYKRLINRQYGHIILHENGLIIDELYFISFREYILQSIQILYIDQHPQIRGLRINTYLERGKNSRNCYFDLFAPSSVSLEQILSIAVTYINRVYGVTGVGLSLGVVHLPGSILSTRS